MPTPLPVASPIADKVAFKWSRTLHILPFALFLAFFAGMVILHEWATLDRLLNDRLQAYHSGMLSLRQSLHLQAAAAGRSEIVRARLIGRYDSESIIDIAPLAPALSSFALEVFDNDDVRMATSSEKPSLLPAILRKRLLLRSTLTDSRTSDYTIANGSLYLYAVEIIRSSPQGPPLGKVLLSLPITPALLQSLKIQHDVELLALWGTPVETTSTRSGAFSFATTDPRPYLQQTDASEYLPSIVKADGEYVLGRYTILRDTTGTIVATLGVASRLVPMAVYALNITIISLLFLTVYATYTISLLKRHNASRRAQNLAVAQLLRNFTPVTLRDGKNASSDIPSIVLEEYDLMVDRFSKHEYESSTIKRKFQSIFDNAFEGLFVSSAEGQLLDANPALITMFGCTDKEDILETLHDLATEAYVDASRRDAFKEQLSAYGQVRNFEAEFRRKDGTRFWGLLSARCVTDENGTQLYEGGLIDTNVQKQRMEEECAQEAGRRFRQARMEMLQELGTLLSEPCNIITAACNSITDERAHSAPPQLADIIRSCQRLHRLADNLQDFARAESGTLMLHEGFCDLHKVLQASADSSPETGDCPVISVELSPELPIIVSADAGRLRQCIQLAASIHRQHRPCKGVHLSATPAAPSTESGTFNRTLGTGECIVSILFTLTDSGSAMRTLTPFRAVAEEELSGIHRRFFATLVKQFDGTILSVASSTCGSTSFIIHFRTHKSPAHPPHQAHQAHQEDKASSPLSRTAPQSTPLHDDAQRNISLTALTTEPETAQQRGTEQAQDKNTTPPDANTKQLAPSRPRRTALAICPDHNDARLMELLLSQLAMDCSICPSALEVRSSLRDTAPDFVFLDLEIPGTNGFKIAATIHAAMAERGKESPPIIAISLHPKELVEKAAAEAGISAIVTKPVTASKLKAALLKTRAAHAPSPSTDTTQSNHKENASGLFSPIAGRLELLRRATAGKNPAAIRRMLPAMLDTLPESVATECAPISGTMRRNLDEENWKELMADIERIAALYTNRSGISV
ncbi:MAG: response regulator [Halodesulfovibrio sp.]